MKFNWGTGITLFYASFMAILLFFVVKTTTHDNSLVMENYYEQDLKYQSHYDRVLNTQELEQQVAFKINNAAQNIEVQFPDEMKKITGSIQLFRPSTKHRDVFLNLKINADGIMIFPTKQLKSGRWKIKMNWQNGEREYYSEKDIEL